MRLGIGVLVHEAAQLCQGGLTVSGLALVIGLDDSVHDFVELCLAALIAGNCLAVTRQYLWRELGIFEVLFCVFEALVYVAVECFDLAVGTADGADSLVEQQSLHKPQNGALQTDCV